MIPRKIHYCWFGGNPLPDDVQNYIKGWRQICPDFEIVCWDENNFDINSVPYVKEAYENKKWAFITDYVRLYALYHHGGIYMDTDVELLRPIDCFLQEEAFSGFESETTVPTGIMASEPKQRVIGDLLKDYDGRHFVNEKGELDLSTNVEAITRYFMKNGLLLNNQKQTVNGFTMYPHDYFCPKNSRTLKIELTENSYTIHHFAGSWVESGTKFRKIVKKILGSSLSEVMVKLMDKFGIK